MHAFYAPLSVPSLKETKKRGKREEKRRESKRATNNNLILLHKTIHITDKE